MNRDTKFRGKRKDNGLWVEGSLLRFGERRFIIPPAWGDFDDKAPLSVALGRSIEVLPETVGEFTGLKDKKGKEIYEGDICQVENQNCEQIIGTVEYFEGMGQWFVARDDGDHEPLWEYSYEVIGNVHQNGESQ